ncbi:biotin carboxylase [Arthrobacter sp. JUb119]|uniref:hypothetical protein n=1 Tax=Arthrobacter sp. JUb115 TaxID=2485108 RepID=UPI00105C7B86|nr:hypothetical protein [Arthrobacter sp. JUb115]MCS3494390.1 biotin carboxylase [Arthrobacter sp. JUb119]TDU22484.1 hypothetical protein EDF61_10914 [Arthrobacter sp. JUb115]
MRLFMLVNPLVMYAVARGLRQEASFILAGLSDAEDKSLHPMSASRYVDAGVWVPPVPQQEWLIDVDCITAPVQEWVSHIQSLCKVFDIDTILPANDHDQFFLTLAQEQFSTLGITVLGPSHHSVRRMNDKYQLMQDAQSVGISVPWTALASQSEVLGKVSRTFPVVLKRRFSQGASEVSYFESSDELRSRIKEISSREPSSNWIVQEYIPGRIEPSCTVFASGSSVFLSAFHIKHRYMAPSASTAVEVVMPFIPETSLHSLVKILDFGGVGGLQFKLDCRDGAVKLIEANARMGQNTRLVLPLVEAAGYDPSKVLLAALENEIHEKFSLRVGDISVSPWDDLVCIWVHINLRGRANRVDNSRPRLSLFIRQILASYSGRRVYLDYISRSLFTDTRAVLRFFARLFARCHNPEPVPWSGSERRHPIRYVQDVA